MLNVNESATSIKPCYKMLRFAPEIWRYAESPYLCGVFFIVLDLRLTKDWLSGKIAFFILSLLAPPKKVSLLKMKKAKTKVRLLAKI